jgi:hypothetical protein
MLALVCPVRPDKTEAIDERDLPRIEVPYEDRIEDAVGVAIEAGGAGIKI